MAGANVGRGRMRATRWRDRRTAPPTSSSST